MPDKIKKPMRRVHVTIPGLLDWVAQRRAREHEYRTNSEYLLELACFDIRGHRDHLITRPYADDTLRVQDAIARAAIRHHAPEFERRGLLVTTILGEVPDPPLGLVPPRGELTAVPRWMVIPLDLWEEAVNLRWRELGYPSFSHYVAGLVLCDVLLSGRHRYYNGGDRDSVILASLDAGTIATYKANKPARLYLDHLLERIAGRKLTAEEIRDRMSEISDEIREYALRARFQDWQPAGRR